MHPIGALSNLSEWLAQYKVAHVWGNGSDFDNAIINNLAKSFGAPKPLNYKRNRCFRTLKALFGQHIPEHATIPMGTHHNALDDAMYQAVQHGYIHRALQK
jgi:exodeoxyribonuclease VIII